MAIIPTVQCRSMRKSLEFYTQILGFERVDGDDSVDDPSFSLLSRGGDRLILSSHRGDGEYGQAVVIEVENVDDQIPCVAGARSRLSTRSEFASSRGSNRPKLGKP